MMSKVAIIGDIHIGVRDDKEVFHKYFEKFFTECFFPELEKRGVKTVIQLGDLFDRRKYVNFQSLKRSKGYLFDPLRDKNMFMYVLVGNHDIALRNTLDINSPELLLSDYLNIEPIAEPTEIEVYNTKFLIVPWICTDNHKESMEMLKNSDAKYCCGHFEIASFQFYRGVESHEGLEPKLFKQFDRVFSGHYHHRSSNGNIQYCGAPCQHTHMDQGDIRGFDILDTETGEIEFVQNPFTMFERFVYDDSKHDPRGIDVSTFSEKYVKIVVNKKTDFCAFDNFMDRVYNSNAYEIKVIETVQDMSAEELDETVDIEDTRTILSHYVDTAEVDVPRDDLKKYINTLYMEALNTET